MIKKEYEYKINAYKKVKDKYDELKEELFYIIEELLPVYCKATGTALNGKLKDFEIEYNEIIIETEDYFRGESDFYSYKMPVEFLYNENRIKKLEEEKKISEEKKLKEKEEEQQRLEELSEKHEREMYEKLKLKYGK